MEVTISVGGRFHAFYLAQQLLKRRYLKKLITSYPKFEVRKYGIPKGKVNPIIIKEILERSWRRLPNFLGNIYNPQYLISDIFDRLTSNKVEFCNIFVGFSSFSLHSIRRAKELSAITILERGSSHILYQKQILREEYEKFGLKPNLPHPKIVEKELEEYEETNYISIPSLFVKRTFLKKGIPEEKLIHIPYGVRLEEFRQMPKEDNIFRIVYAGGMTVQKGIHYLLQAYLELKLPNSELLLIGGLTDEIKPFFKKYEGNYKWIGHKPQRELYKYYSQGSVFVTMSIQDGFGMVISQAMACSLPVICTTNTGGEDIIRDGIDGFVIPIRDVKALKEKITYLYENPDICKAMGQSAKDRVTKGFTWDDYGDKMIKEYERILNEKK